MKQRKRKGSSEWMCNCKQWPEKVSLRTSHLSKKTQGDDGGSHADRYLVRKCSKQKKHQVKKNQNKTQQNKQKQTKKNQRGTMSAAFGEMFLHAYGKIQQKGGK